MLHKIKWMKGDIVDSVAGRFTNGEVKEIRKESGMTILTIQWANGLIQDRSEDIVRRRDYNVRDKR